MDDNQPQPANVHMTRNDRAEQQAAELIDKAMEVTQACRELTTENNHLRHLLSTRKSELSGNKVGDEQVERPLNTHEETIRALQLQIEEQQDKIFSMQHVQQVSDAEIQRQYKDLCSSICHWIDQYYDDGNASVPFHQSINIDWQPQYHDFLFNTLRQSGFSLSQGCPAASPAMVEFFLHSSLHWEIFRYRDYLPGSTEKQEEFLQLIERNMKQLRPKRSKWRGVC
jgi:chromosome segregation ATPase